MICGSQLIEQISLVKVDVEALSVHEPYRDRTGTTSSVLKRLEAVVIVPDIEESELV